MVFMFSFRLSSFLLLSLIVCLSNAQTQTGVVQNNSIFDIGVILDSSSLVGRIGLTSLSLALSDFYSLNGNYSTRIVLHVRDSNGQVIDAAASALSLLKDVKVDAIIGPQKSSQASFLIGLGDRANVPIVSFSATSPYLHSLSPYFVQTALNDAAQVGAVASIVKYFKWTQVVLVYEESDYGNGIITYMSNAFQDMGARISYRSVIPLSSTDDFILQELYKMQTMQTRVFVVHMSSSLASTFFLKVKETGMMSQDYVWIVTSGLMDLFYYLNLNVIASMEGVIGVKPLIPTSQELISTGERWKRKFLQDNNGSISQAEVNSYVVWAYDTLWALTMAAERVGVKVPSTSSSSRNNTGLLATGTSQTGPKLLKALSEMTFQGLGGVFHLANGQFGPSPFQIINVVQNKEIGVGLWTPSQGISSTLQSNSSFQMKDIIVFPGNSKVVPKGWVVPVAGKKLRVGVLAVADFPQFVKVEKDTQTNGFKFSGAYIDMFDAVMGALPYSVPYEYVPFGNPDGSMAGSHDELIYQVFLQNYDAAVGSITITSNRSRFADYTLPFAEGGITMTVPVAYENPNNKWIFFSPLTKQLWLAALALFILTGLALWMLEHRFNIAYRGPPAQHAGMIFYFPFLGWDRVVNNLGRVVVIVWMFVVLILSSTYTASLSARLTVQRLKPAVNDATELIKNGDYIGVREGSFVFDFVQGLGFNKSKIRTYNSLEGIDDALSKGSEKGGISAFFCVMPSTKLFLSNYCEKYTTVGQIYPTEGVAYAFQIGSPLVADVSRSVIQLTESGKISEIMGHYVKNQSCNGPAATINASQVSFESFETLFAITGGVTLVCVAVFLFSYAYQNRDHLRRILSNSNSTIWSKVGAVLKDFDQRDPKSFKRDQEEGERAPPTPSEAYGIPHFSSSAVFPFSSPETNEHSDGEIIAPTPEHTPTPDQTADGNIQLVVVH